MRKIQVVTRWVKEDEANVPAVLSFLGAGDSAVDVTGQSVDKLTAEPDAVVWELVCSEATYEAIMADKEHVVLWDQQLSEVQDEEGNVVLGQYEVSDDDDSKAASTSKDISDLQLAFDERSVGKISAIDSVLVDKIGISRIDLATELVATLRGMDDKVEVGKAGLEV